MNSCTLASPRIVVLAAGFSTRLGSSKALARVRGRSLLDRTLEVLAPFATRSIVVVIPPGAGRYRIGRRVHRPTFVVNSRRAQGLSSSVCRAITYARYSCAVLLLPVDLVELERRDIAKLISRWRGAGGPGGGRPPTPPPPNLPKIFTFGGAPRRRVAARSLRSQAATPLILPRWLYRQALGISGDHGLRDLVRTLPSPHVLLVNMPSADADVDTALDLQRARRRAHHRA
jgi:CTP:molybdopterin cytidylyltransferase MocA